MFKTDGRPNWPRLARFSAWLLAAGGLILAWSWRAPAPSERLVPQPASPATTAAPPLAQPRASEGMAAQVERALLEPAQRDPFLAYEPPVKVVVKAPPPPPTVIMQAEAPVPPLPPPLNMRYAGQMTTPDGKQVVFAMAGDTPVTLELGQIVPSGYRVRTIGPTYVEFEHPATQTQVRLDLPSPPAYQIR